MTTNRIAALLAQLEKHPLVRKLTMDEDVARLARRRELASEIAKVRAGLAARNPKLVATVTTTQEALEAARAALRKAELDAGAARADLAGTSAGVDLLCVRCERELRETASPAIDAAIERWTERWEQGRREGPAVEDNRERNLAGRRFGPIRTNRPSQLAYLAGLRTAIASAEALKLEPLTEAEVAERLAAFEAAQPDPTVMVEIP